MRSDPGRHTVKKGNPREDVSSSAGFIFFTKCLGLAAQLKNAELPVNLLIRKYKMIRGKELGVCLHKILNLRNKGYLIYERY